MRIDHSRLMRLIGLASLTAVIATAVLTWWTQSLTDVANGPLAVDDSSVRPADGSMLAVVPDCGEPRTARILRLEQAVDRCRGNRATPATVYADTLLELADVRIQLQRFAGGQEAIEAVRQLRPDPQTWQNRDAEFLQQDVRTWETLDDLQKRRRRDRMSHHERALRLHVSGDYIAAIGAARQAVVLQRQLLSSESRSATAADRARLADELLLLGRLALEHSDTWTEAHSILTEARDLCLEVRGSIHPVFAEILTALAGVDEDRGNFEDANGLYEEALHVLLQTRGEQSLDYARTLARQGRLHLTWWKDFAMGKCLRAQQIREQIVGHEHPDYAESLEDLALLAINLFDFNRGESLANQALAIRRAAQGNDHPELAEALSSLAICSTERGNLAKALVCQRQAIRLCEGARGSVHPLSARYQLDLALRYDADYDFSRSCRMFDQCLSTLRSLGLTHNPLFASALFYYADCVEWEAVFFEISDDPNLRRAEDMLEELVSLFSTTPGGTSLPVYPWALLKLVEVHYFENYRRLSYSDAWRLFEQAVENVAVNGGKDHPIYGELFYTRGRLFMSQGEYRDAQTALEKFVEIEEKRFGKVRINRYARSVGALTGMYIHQGTQPELAAQMMRASLEMMMERFRTNSLSQSDLSRLGLIFHVQYLVGAILSTGADSANQERLYQDIVASRGAVTALQSADRVARDHQQLAPLMDHVRQARLVLKRLACDPDSAESPEQWLKSLQTASDDREDAENDLALAAREFILSDAAILVSDLQAVIPEEGVFIDFLRYLHHGPPPGHRGPLAREFRMVAFVVRPHAAPVAIPLGASRTIELAIDHWREAIAKDQRGEAADVQDAAAAVSRLVWEPLVESLGSARTVLIAPDGPVCYLPFAALPGQTDDVYLLEEYSLGYVTSARMAVQLLREAALHANSGLLAVGGINYESSAANLLTTMSHGKTRFASLLPEGNVWTKLPSTGFEAEQLICTWQEQGIGDSRTKLLTGDVNLASVVSDLGKHWRYVHFAGHGFFAEEKLPAGLGSVVSGRTVRERGDQEYFLQRNQNLMSGLVLSAGQTPDEEILTAEDIASLDLRGTELVVLSACDTGLGRTAGGEGVIGLKRALLTAGAQSVVTSLWKVDDSATCLLMKQFYDNLFRRQLSKSQALREAQIYVLHHPDQIIDQSNLLAARGIGVGRTKPLPAASDIPVSTPSPTAVGSPKVRASPAAWAAFVLYGDGR